MIIGQTSVHSVMFTVVMYFLLKQEMKANFFIEVLGGISPDIFIRASDWAKSV